MKGRRPTPSGPVEETLAVPSTGHLGIERALLGGGVVDTPGESLDHSDVQELVDAAHAPSGRSVYQGWCEDWEDAFGMCVDRPFRPEDWDFTEGMVLSWDSGLPLEGCPGVEHSGDSGSFERYRGLDLDLQPSDPTPVDRKSTRLNSSHR